MHKTCRFCLFLALGLTACDSEEDKSAEEPAAVPPSHGGAQKAVESRTALKPNGSPLSDTTSASGELANADWRVPVAGIKAEALQNTWGDARSAGRRHEGIDIMAPRGTPVVAAANGEVVKKFLSDRGGLTLYVSVKGGELLHYYAHLETYAEGIEEGLQISAGTQIGTVGSSGNAPDNAPHLHFEVHRMNGSANWWEGEAVNPWRYLTGFE